MEGLSKKVATNDKILENISNRMDSFASTIKNQHSFNKMIESQIAQLVLMFLRPTKLRFWGNWKI